MEKPKKALTNLSNDGQFKDAYGNSLWLEGDEFPPFSTRDPAGSGNGRVALGIGATPFGPWEVENPYGGDFRSSGSYHCNTCKSDVSIVEIAKPSHLGHDMEYGNGKDNYDVASVPRKGGEYMIEMKAMNLPNDGAYSPKPLEELPNTNITDVAASSVGSIYQTVDDKTQPM